MAGKFGSIIDTANYAGTSSPNHPVHYAGGYVWVIAYVYNSNCYIKTIKLDPNTGVFTGGASLTLSGGNFTYASDVVEVSSGVWAIWTYQNYYYCRLTKFSVDTSTGALAVLHVHSWSSSYIEPQGTPIRIGDTTTFACPMTYSTGGVKYVRLYTFTIATDGSSSSVITYNAQAVQAVVTTSTLYHLTGNIYVAFVAQKTKPTLMKSYTISDDGSIAAISSATLDSADGPSSGDHWVRACNIDGIVWAAAYATSSSKRIRTFEINDNGSFGSTLDTEDGLISGATAQSMELIPENVLLVCFGGTTTCEVRTIRVSDAGAIGSVVDTLSGVSGHFAIFTYAGSKNVFVGVYDTSDYHSYWASVDVTRGVTYTPGARVAGLRHVYRPGSYRLETTFGDISSTVDVVKHKVVLPPSPVEKEGEGEEARTIEVPQKTAPEIVRAVEEEGLGTPIIGGPALPGIIPGAVKDPLEEYLESVKERQERERLGAYVSQAVAGAGKKQSLWSKITPWKEEEGETFGSEFMERLESFAGWMGRFFLNK
jgi:hypothetical protein